MGLYNIINPTTMQGGQPEDVGQVLANFQAIQAILNGGIDNTNIANGILASKLAGYPADATKSLRGDGSWLTSSGALVLDYKEIAVTQTANALTEAGANTIITGNPVVYDGVTPVWVEYFSVAVQGSTVMNIHVWLFMDGVSLGEIAAVGQGSATLAVPTNARRKLTPSAGSHTFSIRSSVTSGTASFIAGTGGVGTDNPMFLQVLKAS